MPTAFDNRRLVDGVAEVLLTDNNLTLDTDGVVACTATVLTMDTSPLAAGFRAGDAIKVTSTGSEVRKITAVDATTITVSPGFSVAPGLSVAIVRAGVNIGYTQDGVTLKSKTNLQERNADQSLDPIAVKADKRDSSITFNMLEVFGESVEKAFMLDPSAVVVNGSETTFKFGNSTLTLNTFGAMILGFREDGQAVTIFASKCANQGEAALNFAKDKAAALPMDLKLINDSSRPAGEELFVMVFDTAHKLDLLA